MKTLSLEGRMTLVVAGSAIVGALVFAGVSIWPFPQVLAWIRAVPDKAGKLPAVMPIEPFDGGTALIICLLVLLPLSAWVAHALDGATATPDARAGKRGGELSRRRFQHVHRYHAAR